jgi:AcrR family transcriptional regulator
MARNGARSPAARARRPRGARRERRSHAERTAETRARILAAVRDCIAELGFRRTTASEITRRAGVTWGAVQHHFGDKDGILAAVLEDSFERFEARLAGVPVEGAPLGRRAALFVERAWEHFGSAHYRSTFEILLQDAPRAGAAGAGSWQRRMARAWDRVWRRLFADARIGRARQIALQHYAICVLAGLATTQLLEGEDAAARPAALELLAETLARELAGAAA